MKTLKKNIYLKKIEKITTNFPLIFLLQCNNLSARDWWLLKHQWTELEVILIKNKIARLLSRSIISDDNPFQGPTVLIACSEISQAKIFLRFFLHPSGRENKKLISTVSRFSVEKPFTDSNFENWTPNFLFIGGFFQTRPILQKDLKKFLKNNESIYRELIMAVNLQQDIIKLLSGQQAQLIFLSQKRVESLDKKNKEIL